MDFLSGTVNFRDVGASVNDLAGRPLLLERTLFRSGELALVKDLAEVGSPHSIINLESFPDRTWDTDTNTDPRTTAGIPNVHLPFPDIAEVYDLDSEATRTWLRSVLETCADPYLELPLLIHCTAGKDRTGVAIAALLAVIGVPKDIIIQEYELSAGGMLYPNSIARIVDNIISDGQFAGSNFHHALAARLHL